MPQSAGNVEYLSETNEVVAIENIFKNISIATPYMDLIEEFTLTEQLQFHFKLRNSRASLSIEEMIRRMYLENAHNKYISNFSSGMRQRVKLALAFFTEAEIIFLDEPGTNLDKQAFDWYINQLHSLPAQSLVFIASNQPDEYPESAHKINILDYK
jgi:ABC-type multidrug transport system ATPase subunit